jgi:putative ABC transport system permease protein
MLKNYMQIAWRHLFNNRIYTIINILGLAIGISACLVIFLISSFELSYDKFHPDKERIFRLVSSYQEPGDYEPFYPNNISHAASHIIRDEYSGIDQLANFYSYHAQVTVPRRGRNMKSAEFQIEQGNRWDIIITEPQYFSIFQYKWLAGTPTSSLSQPFHVVLAESKARKYFGSIPMDQILGKELIYDDSLHLRVSGIVKDWDKNTDLNFKDFISYSTIEMSFLKSVGGFDNPSRPDSWGERSYAQTYIMLKKGVEAASFKAWASTMIRNRRPINMKGEKVNIDLQPISTLHFESKYFSDKYSRQVHLPTIYALIGISAFILIIAMINFINLSTALSVRRSKEIGIRKVLGSYRIGIVLQFLTETFIVVLFAVILSILFANLVLHGFLEFIPPGLGPAELIKSNTLIFLTIVTVITSLLAGIYPARILSSYTPALSLKGQTSGALHQKHYLRKLLILFQFTISLFFIIATIIIGRQIHYMLNKDLGFTKDAILNISINGINPNLHYTPAERELFVEKVRKLAGVSMVSLNYGPVALNWDPSSKLKDIETGNQLALSCRFADENFVALYGLKIIAGRNIRVPQSDSLTEFLVNVTCTKELGFRRPEYAIGHMMGAYVSSHGIATGPIVGILAEFNSQSLLKPISALFIAATRNDAFMGTVSVKLAASEDESSQYKATLTKIEKAWKEIYPTEKFKYTFFDEDIARFYGEEQKNSKIMNAAMVIAIFISCMGLFGLSTFTAEQRTREISIRKVLGATVSRIIIMLSKQFLKLVFVSIIIASPFAWYLMHQWLQGFAFRIEISWWIFVLAGLGAALIALITVSFQAIKAAIANPVKSLKIE